MDEVRDRTHPGILRDVEGDAEDWMKREGLEGHVKRTMRVIGVSKIQKLGYA